ncbi:hypothetical protein DPMN_189398 [Dreissena polymorpha]|uniref:Fibronectin type-III domain-containing protein n=1 Tax=Dreissena polymorpha TaxID=45954 RepID=A0A9D4DVF9_DREPO|nr:hypothetical protein DPMN_189398 [Dreissena polymorpha]
MCKSRIVTGLKTGVKFKFRVMAENIYGIGEPLETDCPVLVKNRFEPPDQEDSNSEEDSEEDTPVVDTVALSTATTNKSKATTSKSKATTSQFKVSTKATTSSVGKKA